MVDPVSTELGHLDLSGGKYVLAAKVHTDNEGLIAAASLPAGARIALSCTHTGTGNVVEMKRVRMTATQVAVLEQTSG